MMKYLMIIIIMIIKVSYISNHSHHYDIQEENIHGNMPMIQLLGVQKGGSSSLYFFLIQHPLVSKNISSLIIRINHINYINHYQYN